MTEMIQQAQRQLYALRVLRDAVAARRSGAWCRFCRFRRW